MISQIARSITAVFSGASATAAITIGPEVVNWLADELHLPKGTIVLTSIFTFIAGFLLMYIYRQLVLNPKLTETKYHIDSFHSKAVSTLLGKTKDAASLLVHGKMDELPDDVKSAAKQIIKTAKADTTVAFDALYGEGIAFVIEGKLANAVKVFRKAKAIKPDDHRAYAGLACAYVKLKKFQSANACLARAEQHTPPEPTAEILRLYADIYFQLGDYNRSYQSYGKYLTLRSNDAKAHYFHAQARILVWQAAGNHPSDWSEVEEDVLSELENAVAIEPSLKTNIKQDSTLGKPFHVFGSNERLTKLIQNRSGTREILHEELRTEV